MQTMRETPLARNASALRTKLGICAFVQVPVKAPGRPNRATLPCIRSAVSTVSGPASPTRSNWPWGSLSPAVMVIAFS